MVLRLGVLPVPLAWLGFLGLGLGLGGVVLGQPGDLVGAEILKAEDFQEGCLQIGFQFIHLRSLIPRSRRERIFLIQQLEQVLQGQQLLDHQFQELNVLLVFGMLFLLQYHEEHVEEPF